MFYSDPFKQKESTSIFIPYKIFAAPPFYPMQPHFHMAIELMYFSDDISSVYICDGTEYSIHAGDIIVVNSNQVHACNYTSMKSKIICVMVSNMFLYSIKHTNTLYKNHISDDPRMAEIFETILPCDEHMDSTVKFANMATICRLFSMLSQDYTVDGIKKEHATKPYQLKIVEKVIEHIEKYYAEKITVEELAALSSLSVSRFAHLFLDIVGISPVIYINQVRMSKACSLLFETDLDISEIACDCGFNSPSYFAEQFKKYIKITPTEYRNCAVKAKKQIIVSV